jgi:hypothetical protein
MEYSENIEDYIVDFTKYKAELVDLQGEEPSKNNNYGYLQLPVLDQTDIDKINDYAKKYLKIDSYINASSHINNIDDNEYTTENNRNYIKSFNNKNNTTYEEPNQIEVKIGGAPVYLNPKINIPRDRDIFNSWTTNICAALPQPYKIIFLIDEYTNDDVATNVDINPYVVRMEIPNVGERNVTIKMVVFDTATLIDSYYETIYYTTTNNNTTAPQPTIYVDKSLTINSNIRWNKYRLTTTTPINALDLSARASDGLNYFGYICDTINCLNGDIILNINNLHITADRCFYLFNSPKSLTFINHPINVDAFITPQSRPQGFTFNVIANTIQEKTEMRCYSHHWDTLMNSYLLDPNFQLRQNQQNLNYYNQPTGCRHFVAPQNPTPNELRNYVIQEVNYKQQIYNAIILFKGKLSTEHGVSFRRGNGTYNTNTVVYRGMSRPFAFTGNTSCLVLNFLSTTMDRDVAISFTGNPTPANPGYLYVINVQPYCPYIAYDEVSGLGDPVTNNLQSYVSYYGTRESEILFTNRCVITFVRNLNPLPGNINVVEVNLSYSNLPILADVTHLINEQNNNTTYFRIPNFNVISLPQAPTPTAPTPTAPTPTAPTPTAPTPTAPTQTAPTQTALAMEGGHPKKTKKRRKLNKLRTKKRRKLNKLKTKKRRKNKGT